MQFRSQVTIRKADGSLLAPIVLLHEDEDMLSGVLFLQSIGRQMGWHRNGEVCGLQLQVGPTPENPTGDKAPSFIPTLVPSPPEAHMVDALPNNDFETIFSSLDSPSCSPRGAITS